MHGEFYKAINDRAYFGVKVFIGDELCNEIHFRTPTSYFDGTEGFLTASGKKSYRKEGSTFYVHCDSPITGSSVRIETDRRPLATDLYKSGLALCDIRVILNTRERSSDDRTEYTGELRLGYGEPSRLT